MPDDARTPIVLVAGLAAATSRAVADALLDRHTAVVHHDLSRLGEGVVVRRMRLGIRDSTTILELAHGCVSCMLRQDVLPLVRVLSNTPRVRRIVLHLDPAQEPEAVCWAMTHVLVDGSPVDAVADVRGVITIVDAATWFEDATGSDDLEDREIAAGPDDERTVAHLAVGQVEFADAVVVAGVAPDVATAQRIDAILDRLVPGAPRVRAAHLDPEALLAAIPEFSRRGKVDDAYAPLTPPFYPMNDEHGVGTVVFAARRPFHPERLHEALDALLDGVVRARGRIWVATQPEQALCLESAGGGLGIAQAGPWLATVETWSEVDSERAAMASLRWDDRFGDREQALAVLYHRADPCKIADALRAALITDAELAAGEDE